MTNYHEFYDNRIGEVEKLMRMQWQDDEDVMQEARIGVYRALLRNPGAVAKYLFISGKHAAIGYLEKGKSVDNAKFSRYRNSKANGDRPRVRRKCGKETEEGQCKICEFRTEEWEGLTNPSMQVDEQVIFMGIPAKSSSVVWTRKRRPSPGPTSMEMPTVSSHQANISSNPTGNSSPIK
jgi:hypothetical protein